MFALHTNKSLKNLYGASASAAKKRVEFFVNNPQWYIERGIPHTLGILMHGAPGCGKTSFIKAVARDTGRHVVNIKMGPTTTIQQVNNLFYTPRLSVLREGATQAYDIPMDKRIIVMEDVDCLSCVVREASNQNEDPHRLNLSILLNILDGVLETPGRIVIMTTNAPEKIDAALKRPGRIDVMIEFKKCSVQDTVDMIEGITGYKVSKDKYASIANDVWTPAEITKTIFENIDAPEKCLEVFQKKEEEVSEKRLEMVEEDINTSEKCIDVIQKKGKGDQEICPLLDEDIIVPEIWPMREWNLHDHMYQNNRDLTVIPFDGEFSKQVF
jgi:chaperone BCS1